MPHDLHKGPDKEEPCCLVPVVPPPPQVKHWLGVGPPFLWLVARGAMLL